MYDMVFKLSYVLDRKLLKKKDEVRMTSAQYITKAIEEAVKTRKELAELQSHLKIS